jgi:hypothetical protein
VLGQAIVGMLAEPMVPIAALPVRVDMNRHAA